MKSSLEISLFRSHNNLGGRPRCFRLIDFLIIEFRKAEISPWKQSSLSVSTSLSDPVRHPSSATVCRLREEAGHFSLRKDFILPGLPTPFMPSAFLRGVLHFPVWKQDQAVGEGASLWGGTPLANDRRFQPLDHDKLALFSSKQERFPLATHKSLAVSVYCLESASDDAYTNVPMSLSTPHLSFPSLLPRILLNNHFSRRREKKSLHAKWRHEMPLQLRNSGSEEHPSEWNDKV